MNRSTFATDCLELPFAIILSPCFSKNNVLPEMLYDVISYPMICSVVVINLIVYRINVIHIYTLCKHIYTIICNFMYSRIAICIVSLLIFVESSALIAMYSLDCSLQISFSIISISLSDWLFLFFIEINNGRG